MSIDCCVNMAVASGLIGSAECMLNCLGRDCLSATPFRKFCVNLKWLSALVIVLGSRSGWSNMLRGAKDSLVRAVMDVDGARVVFARSSPVVDLY